VRGGRRGFDGHYQRDGVRAGAGARGQGTVLCGALDYAECRGWRAAISACRWAVERVSPARQLSIITVSSSRPGMVPAHSPRRKYVGILSAIGAGDRRSSIESRRVLSRHYAESTPRQPAGHGLGDG
jgi:hypothetical protein